MKTNNQTKNTICPSCFSKACTYSFSKNEWDLYVCATCQLMFVWPMPGSVHDIYQKSYFVGAEGGYGYSNYEADKLATQKTFDLFLSKITKYKKDNGRLLDIGAATGYFVERARAKGFDAEGLEISSYAVEEGKRLGRKILQGTLEEVDFEKDSFDVITMLDVFEHLPNPHDQLKEVRYILKKDGLLVLNMPDRGSVLSRILGKHWHLIVPPEHLLYFTQSSFIKLATSYGFEHVETSRYVKRFPLPYVLITLARYFNSHTIHRIAQLIEHTWFRYISFPIPTYDNFFMILRKNETISLS